MRLIAVVTALSAAFGIALAPRTPQGVIVGFLAGSAIALAAFALEIALQGRRAGLLRRLPVAAVLLLRTCIYAAFFLIIPNTMSALVSGSWGAFMAPWRDRNGTAIVLSFGFAFAINSCPAVRHAHPDCPDAFSQISPSGIIGGSGLPLERVGEPATIEEIEEVLEAYAIAAQSARELGFDGIEIHGAHGYLIDQFLWRATNLRDDEYGGDIPRRSHFASEVVRRIRQAVGTDFPIVMRLSTWKQQDYTAKLVESPEDWQAVVQPMAEAGVDAFHVSQRRYWEGEFGTNLNLAGWTKKLTGKPTITVGSVSLGNSMAEMMLGHGSAPIDNLEPLLDGFERGDFDVVAVGRAMIANPDWPQRIRSGAPLTSYSLNMLQSLD